MCGHDWFLPCPIEDWGFYKFIFTFDTFGFLAPEVDDLLKRFQRVTHKNIMSSKFINIVFKN